MVGYRAFDVPAALHRGLPSSRLTFIVALDDGVEAAASETALPGVRPAPVVAGGLHTVASYVRQRSGQAGVQLAVHPLAARSLFGLPAAELPVAEFDGTESLGRWVAELHGRLADAAMRGTTNTTMSGARSGPEAWGELFRVVADELARRHRAHADVRPFGIRPELRHAWHLLERSGGRTTVGELASATALSARHLNTLFHRELGRSPKQVAGLMRFENATGALARQVRSTGRADLAHVAAAAGYSDQAHLSREFARYAGITPRAWVAQELRNIQDGGHGAAGDWHYE